MKSLKKENEELKLQLSEALRVIDEQKALIKKLEEDFALNLYEGIDQAFNNFSGILNPLPISLKASHSGKGELFSIKATDIVCIIGDGRMKNIYLSSLHKNLTGTPRQTNKVTINSNTITLEKLRHNLDSISYHLFKVNSNRVVNLPYYCLNGNYVELTLPKMKHLPAECHKIKIAKSYKDEFIARKAMIDDYIKLHKSFARYIV